MGVRVHESTPILAVYQQVFCVSEVRSYAVGQVKCHFEARTHSLFLGPKELSNEAMAKLMQIEEEDKGIKFSLLSLLYPADRPVRWMLNVPSKLVTGSCVRL